MPNLAHNYRGDDIPDDNSHVERDMVNENQRNERSNPVVILQNGERGAYDSPISSKSLGVTGRAIKRRWNVPKSARRKIIENLVIAAQSENCTTAARAAALLLQAEREDNLRIARAEGQTGKSTVVNQQINLNGMSQKQLEELPAEELVKLLRG